MEWLCERFRSMEPPSSWEERVDVPALDCAPALKYVHWPGIDEESYERMKRVLPFIQVSGRCENTSRPRMHALSPASYSGAASNSKGKEDNDDDSDVIYLPRSALVPTPCRLYTSSPSASGRNPSRYISNSLQAYNNRHRTDVIRDKPRHDPPPTFNANGCLSIGSCPFRHNTNLDDIVLRTLGPELFKLVTMPVKEDESLLGEIHIAERFRLAFVSRDFRLGSKRAKNNRQKARRDKIEYDEFSDDFHL
mmetsp:Transcript_13341/g.18229  ORF Transcript_13341/g.18229 Transcript_13341/m.18229 type:complete len:250 (-) Transcript_13341:191-940(-)